MEVLPISQSVMLLTYLLKAGVTLALFYILYRLLMRRETFHRLNRGLLLGMLVVSFILPLCEITVHRESPAENKGAIVQGLWSAPPEFLLSENTASSVWNNPQENVAMETSAVEAGAENDNDREAWVNAIKANEMNWIHVSDLQYWESEAARQYNINSVPSNFLIDCSTGCIVAKNLRGEELAEKLAELL